MKLRHLTIVALVTFAFASCGPKWSEQDFEGYTVVNQDGGSTLGYNRESGLQILTVDGYAFKDLNRNGELDPYEDWRLDARSRAEDLSSQLSLEEIAGLMLYSTHQYIPLDVEGIWYKGYGGKGITESGLPHSAMTDDQKRFLKDDHVRAVLMSTTENAVTAAVWANNLQAYVEGLDHGIPVNISSDPRNETQGQYEFNGGSGGDISMWPPQIGLAATFDPELVRRFGQVMASEYRAMGIGTALSPQVDLGTEPRWGRFYGTFGEDPELCADLSRAYIDGCQTSFGEDEIADGWGYASVNAMAKHWPGGGAEEGGRDAHNGFGKFCVYPGDGLQTSIYPFVQGAFNLEGKTRQAAAVMPYYTISWNQDPSGGNVGNSFSHYIITDLLREKYGFDGVVCTDWGITHPYEVLDWTDGKPWGVENLSETERHYLALKAGVDQFGGNNAVQPVLDCYRMWSEEFGEPAARERFRKSAERLLLNIFRIGLFENPYVDIEHTRATVGCPEYMQEGYEAQLKSVVMLKNHDGVLPIRERKSVYVPKDTLGAYVLDSALVSRYYNFVSDPSEADFALVLLNAPDAGSGYWRGDRALGGNGYVPITLQYKPYTAYAAREESIAGGDPQEDFFNRSYRGKTFEAPNSEELDYLLSTRKLMGSKPVITAVISQRTVMPGEIEPVSDGLLLAFKVQHQAILDIVSGAVEPSALLPVQMPADMAAVEEQKEDVPRDMRGYLDSDGNLYDFAFGLNWNGRISDERTLKYGAVPEFAQFDEGLVGSIEPEGWIKEFLERMRDGMTGHPEGITYPYTSCLWAGNMSRNRDDYGSDWWRYEQTAYYTDGLLRLGYELGDPALIEKGEAGIHYIMDRITPEGVIGPQNAEGIMWPMCVFFRVMQAYYEYTHDEAIPAALEKHYLTFPVEKIEEWRNIITIEGMLWTYAHTGNHRLLEMCEQAWNSGKSGDLTPEACLADKLPYMHGVTMCEELKLPMMLYRYTGDKRYLELAERADWLIDRDHMLPDGIPSSAEHIEGHWNVINSHETCDISDYTWTMGHFLMTTGEGRWADKIERGVFNAGPGAITKDFRSLQYFSSVNQVIATGNSNHNPFFHGSTWMAYRPTHETECCAGNVHRFMPNYVSRMWLKGSEGPVAALYGPSAVNYELADGSKVRIEEKTSYPFEGKVEFKFSLKGRHSFAFTFRIPEWCEGASVSLNGREMDLECTPGKFVSVNREWKKGDKLVVDLPMEPRLEEAEGQGVYVCRGPLLYSFPVPQEKVEDNNYYENMFGKVPEDSTFKCWSITPAGEWNYALTGLDAFSPEVELTGAKGYPLDASNVPVTITVPVKKIDWSLQEDRYTPELPAPGSAAKLSDEVQYIKLVPYGSTELRVTVFPTVE